MITSLVTSTGAVLLWPSNQAAAITTVDQMSMTDKAKSFVYYKALSKCISDNSLKDNRGTSPSASLAAAGISEEHASSGDWFWDGAGSSPNVDIGYTLGNTSQNTVSCNNGWISDAAAVWGYSNAVDLLCDTGAQRVSGQDCRAGSGWFKGGWSAIGVVGERLVLETFQSNIKNKVYNGDEPGMPQEAWYIYWRNSFYAGCLGTMSPTVWTGAADNFTYTVEVPNSNWDGGTHSETYYGQRTGSSSIASTAVGSLTCQQLAQEVNNNAPAYALWAKDNSGAAAIEDNQLYPDSSDTTTCGSEVSGIGWMICPIIDGLTALNDGVWSLVSGLLTVDPLESSGDLYNTWGAMRNLANVVFILVFFVMVFSQLTSFGIDNYGVKKLLPKLILGIILVNLSYIIMQIAVDLANIVGSSLYAILTSIAPANQPSWVALVNLLLQGAVGGAVGVIALATIGGVSTAFWLLLPFALMGALSLLAALITLIFRQAIIPILAILAPLAFVVYLLPNTESWFKKWSSLVVSMLMLYPLAAVVFGGAQLAAKLIIGDGSDWWKLLIGLIMLTLPLFSLPFLARQGGPLLAKVGGTLTGLASKTRKPISGLTKGQAELSRNKYLSTPSRWSKTPKALGQYINRRRLRTGLRTEAYKSQQDTMFGRDVAGNVENYAKGMSKDSAARAYIEGAAARAEDKDRAAALVPLAREYANVKATGKDFSNNSYENNNTDEFLKARANDPAKTSAERAAAMERLASDGRDATIRELRAALQGNSTGLRHLEEAVSRNGGALKNKAPDIVKGASSAFKNVTGSELSNFSPDTGRAYMEYLKGLHASGNKEELSTAVNSLNAAVQDIAKNRNLQGAFSGATGEKILETLKGNAAAQISSAPDELLAQLSSISRINESDGKIR